MSNSLKLPKDGLAMQFYLNMEIKKIYFSDGEIHLLISIFQKLLRQHNQMLALNAVFIELLVVMFNKEIHF